VRVLIAVDGSVNAEEVFDAAAPWVRMTGSRAELLTVIDESEVEGTLATEYLPPVTPQGVPETGTALHIEEPRARVVEDRSQAIERVEVEARERLLRLAATHLPHVEYELHIVAADDAADAIIRKARELAVDAIAIGAVGRGIGQSGPVGGVARRVLEHSTVPVFVVRE
jgi:nucleotide-binding universal stress UspA family protein